MKTWMIANKTGGAKLRAGLPANWVVGDKTGGGYEWNDGRRGDYSTAARRYPGNFRLKM